MKLLVIGSGGREHAMAWKLAQSPRTQIVYLANGNGGTAKHPSIQNVQLETIEAMAKFAKQEKVAFTLVGPEAPLAAGIVDYFQAHQLKIFGPSQRAAQLESSKVFAKDFMHRHHIPTAEYQTFSNAQQAHDYLQQYQAPIVIKADGLAAGKGVVVASTIEQAHTAVDQMLTQQAFGQASQKIIIEACLQGEEASFIVMTDGKTLLPLATSQDHKRLLDDDLGPNTGGMGAYSPAPIVTPEVHARIMREIIEPTIRGLNADGIEYQGFLYAGVMIDSQGHPKLLEYNCRMGDPETQPILARLKTDWVNVIEAAINKRLDQIELNWDRRLALGVVLAAENYPTQPKFGAMITGLPLPEQNETLCFHAGTQLNTQGQLHVTGGRVLCVVGLAENMRCAQQKVYQAIESIHFEGMQYRRDIGYREIVKKEKTIS